MPLPLAIPDAMPKSALSPGQIRSLLELTDPEGVAALRREARQAANLHCGHTVFFRGIIEFSNVCNCDCYYCGIRRSNRKLTRYQLTRAEILRQAVWCARQGFGSVILQSGERRDRSFVNFVTTAVQAIKQATRSPLLPDGLGITLCVGEQSREAYQRFFDAGCHRYLLRIETRSPTLFKRWHPADQTLENRLNCLTHLRSIGYQVGTGVMIGAPWQTTADLAADIAWFREQDVDMIGMGPYIPHHAAPLAACAVDPPAARLERALTMIAVVRLVLRDVNIAATTALQALAPLGREQGLACGANVIMPQVTSPGCRKDYTLYDTKPCEDETETGFRKALAGRIRGMGLMVGYNRWGDAPHVRIRQARREGAA